ncbi:hypothetical protein TNIN_342871 [Trichonephila inaurata madagascariensis]|uniref:Uncharacterized protein n=1 Tax=Trichonephila inaurata madagascariensis TaxID=2747483 RepID=A0A8X6IDH6_9ARAC|nr:hypothetical protein TNIN_342871 [Trichonephila inaurata madagascariensis]
MDFLRVAVNNIDMTKMRVKLRRDGRRPLVESNSSGDRRICLPPADPVFVDSVRFVVGAAAVHNTLGHLKIEVLNLMKLFY